LSKKLPTQYSSEKDDLSNIANYDEFMDSIGVVMHECYKLLKPKRYACIIVSDFRHQSRFVDHHADMCREMEKQGFTLEGITILVQNNKNLYPYGIPYAFVSNIHHQYVLIFRKPVRESSPTH
jgi:DNA modification methylase